MQSAKVYVIDQNSTPGGLQTTRDEIDDRGIGILEDRRTVLETIDTIEHKTM